MLHFTLTDVKTFIVPVSESIPIGIVGGVIIFKNRLLAAIYLLYLQKTSLDTQRKCSTSALFLSLEIVKH